MQLPVSFSSMSTPQEVYAAANIVIERLCLVSKERKRPSLTRLMCAASLGDAALGRVSCQANNHDGLNYGKFEGDIYTNIPTSHYIG